MFQQLTLVGNLGRDPELRYTEQGVPVCDFSLAVNEKWTGKDGDAREKTLWFRVTVWRAQAETVAQYLKKGRQVLVVGTLDEPYAYMADDGTPRASLQATAQTVRFLGGGRGDGEPGAARSDDDIPF